MQSQNKFKELARDIARKDKATFETLMEFERTKKIRTKTRLNFTIDRSLAARFKRLCTEKNYNMSAKIETAIKEMLSKEERRD
jgi:post-segregation antitoxin (ccd killing protein)